jgi:protein phosphatase
MKLRCSARTDVGLARDHNEDSYGIAEGEVVDQFGELLVVCDGMGGHAAGEVASRIGVETILAAYYGDSTDERSIALRQAFERANTLIYDQGRGNMGTTGVAALLYHDALHVANVGDSRAYLVRDGDIRQISRDHSFVNDQIDAGIITPEQARTSQHRNVITRALGHQPDVTVDMFRYPLQVGDIVLLSSDGLHGLVFDEELAAIVLEQTPDEAVASLVDLANQRGGSDNITIVLACVEALDWESLPITDEIDIQEIEIARRQSAPPDAAPPADTTATTTDDVEAESPPITAPVLPPPRAAAAPEPAATPQPKPRERAPERRLSLLGGLLAAMVLVVLVFTILFNLPDNSAAEPSAPALAATAPAPQVTTTATPPTVTP